MKARPTDNCPICATQEEKVIGKILSVIQKRSYLKNSLIFKQEEESHGLFLVSKGSVKISKISPAGKEIVLQVVNPGQTFGEGSLLGQSKQPDTASAVEATELFYLPKREFQGILVENPSLYQSVVDSLIRWMDNLNSVIENINTPSAKDRVQLYLERLQEQQQKPIIQLNGKKHDVALMLGLRPETFSRALSDLEAEGVIKMNHKQIQILQKKSLN